MLSLPTTYSYGLARHLPSVYFIALTVRDNGVQKHLYLSSNVTGSIAFTYSGSVVANQTQYLAAEIVNQGQVQSVDGLGEQDFQANIDAGGGLGAVNQTRVTLLNQSQFSTSHAYDFENQSISIWKTHTTGSVVTVETDMLKLFDGVIVGAGDYENTQFFLDCVDRRDVDNKLVPAVLIPAPTSGLTPTNNPFPNADRNAQGHFIPFLIGDFLTPNTVLMSGSNPWAYGKISAAPAVVTDIYQNQAYASDDVYSVGNILFVTDDSSKFISILSGSVQFTVSPVTGSASLPGVNCLKIVPNYGELWTQPAAFGYHADALLSPSGATIFGGIPLQDFSGAVDGATDTYALVDAKGNGSGAWNNSNTFMQVQLQSFSEPGLFIPRTAGDYAYHPIAQDVDFYLGGNFEYHGGALNTDFAVYIMDTDNTVSHMTLTFSSVGQDTPFNQEWAIRCDGANAPGGGWSANLTPMTWELLKSRFLIGIGAIGSAFGSPASDNAKQFKIHNLYIRARTRFDNEGIVKSVQFVPQFGNVATIHPTRSWTDPFNITTTIQQVGGKYEIRGLGISNLFVPGKGVTYTSAMTRSNGHSVGDLIENPAHVIEYILRYKMKVPTANIDSTSFDALGNTTNGSRKDWKVASSLLERKPGFDYIGQICKEFGSTLIMTSDGNYRIIALDTIASGSVVYNVQPTDVLQDGYPQIFVSTTDNSNIFNDYTLGFQFDYTTSRTRNSVFCSDINADSFLENNLLTNTGAPRDTFWTSWCDDSRTRYGGAVKQFKLDSTYIQDQATAELALKNIMGLRAFKRLKVKMILNVNANTLKLQVGDMICITNTLLTSTFSNSAVFMITRINYPPVNRIQAAQITVECTEMPGPNTGSPIYTSRMISSEDLSVH